MNADHPADYPAVIPLHSSVPTSESPTDKPDPPEWLTDKGREAWELLAPLCNFTVRDVFEFASYCEAAGELAESTEMIADVGLVVVDPMSGMPVPNPMTGIRDRADRKIAAWAARFR